MEANQQPESPRRRLRQLVRGKLSLVMALASAGALMATAPNQPPTPKPPPPTLRAAWPQALRADLPGTLPDGVAYSPAFFVDERASVGTAADPGGKTVRLVTRAADGSVRVLRRLPVAAGPRYDGFTRVGNQLVWAESVNGPDGTVRTALWRSELSGGAPRKITEDTGWLSLPGSEYDIVVDSGRLYWTAKSPGIESATEVRSVPIDGGPVEVRKEPGEWTLSRWPWLVSPSRAGRAQLRRIDTADTLEVDAGGDVLDHCGPTWCRVYVLSGDGPSLTELMRPDGSDRRQIADDGATVSIVDVAPMDRFEILSEDSSALGAAIGGQRLLVYDLTANRSVVVADAATSVSYRAGVLWWSTNALGRLSWHTLDLRSV